MIGRVRRYYRRMRASGNDWRWFVQRLAHLAGPAIAAMLAAAPLPAAAGSCEIHAAADCRGANLAGIDLRGRNLRGIDFTGADLSEADLRGADLAGALMVGVRAVNAQLERAYLGDAILDRADLAGATMRRRDVARTTSLSGTRMPDGVSVCAVSSLGLCAGVPARAWKARKAGRRTTRRP